MSGPNIIFGSYSFLDNSCTIIGPGLAAILANGAAPSEEGIRISAVNDINTMTNGADGSGMHSLHASQACRVTVSLLKSSPFNAVLMTAYNFQTSSAANHGKNVLVLVNAVTGDIVTCRGTAYKKAPDLTYAMEGGMVEWEFEAIQGNRVLGAGY